MQEKTDTLKQVTVVGGKIPGNNKSLNPTQSLNSEELSKTNSSTVADAVRHFSGVQLKDYGGIGGLKTINVRSLGSLHTAIFYDGIQLSNVQNGQIDLSKYSLDNIEEISLYNGQSNPVLQPAKAFASSNVLFIESRKPRFEGNEKSHGKLSFRSGSFCLINPSLSFQRKIKKSLAATLSTEYLEADGRYKFRYKNGLLDTSLRRQNGDLQTLRLEAGLNGVSADSLVWTFKIYNFNSEKGLPAVMVGENSESKQRYWDDELFIQSSVRKKIAQYWNLLALAKYSYSYNRYMDPYYPNGGLDNKYLQNELYFSIANSFNVNSFWNAGVAADFTRSTMSENDPDFVEPTRFVGLMSVVSNLKFRQFFLQGNVLTTLFFEKVKKGAKADDRRVFSPALSAMWQPFESINLKVSGFYKHIFRLPTFNDQYFTYSGNSDLEPEYSKQYNAGISYIKAFDGNLKYVSLQVNGYLNRVTNKILATPKGGIFWTMENVGKAEIKGLEANAKSAINLNSISDINLSLNYTLQNAVDITPGNFFNNELPYSPAHSGSAILGLRRKAIGINYNFIYTGAHYNMRANLKDEYAQPWYIHGFSTSWDLKNRRTNYKILAELNNLLDLHYEVVRNFPMPGRSFKVSLNVSY